MVWGWTQVPLVQTSCSIPQLSLEEMHENAKHVCECVLAGARTKIACRTGIWPGVTVSTPAGNRGSNPRLAYAAKEEHAEKVLRKKDCLKA